MCPVVNCITYQSCKAKGSGIIRGITFWHIHCLSQKLQELSKRHNRIGQRVYWAYVMRSTKRDLMSAIINSEIVKYVIDECLTNILKKSKPKGAKMVELQYIESGCKENCILRKTTVKFIILIFVIFGKNLFWNVICAAIFPKEDF